MMRPLTAKTSRSSALAWTAMLCLTVANCGCQLSPASPFANLRSGSSQAVGRNQTSTTTKRAPIESHHDEGTATIRGQSPSGANTFSNGSASGDNYFRGGMGVTNAVATSPTNRYDNISGSQLPTAGVNTAGFVSAAGNQATTQVVPVQYQNAPTPGVYSNQPPMPQYPSQFNNLPQPPNGSSVNRYQAQPEYIPAPGTTGPIYGAQPGTSPTTNYAPNPQYGTAPGSLDSGFTGSGTFNPGIDGGIPQIYGPDGGIPYSPELTFGAAGAPAYEPRIRDVPIDIFVQEARTGRIILGGSVNSDLGVAAQLIVDEQNFDLFKPPTSFRDFFSGRAFRGGGQNFRMELMPGNQVQRYTVNWTERNLLGYMPISLSVGGFYFTRFYRDWNEDRLGGRIMLGYNLTQDLAISGEMRAESVTLEDPRVAGVPELDRALGTSEMYTARARLAHDTRDSPFMATEGHMLELTYDQVFGSFDFPRANINYHKYFLVRERPDRTGRHTLASVMRFGFSGSDTPIYENYFAGGYSTMRGFRFRGASPVTNDVQVGGRFMAIGSLEYVFPITADDNLRGVAFVDYGTIEKDIEFNSDNFRIAPGFGLRVSVPALGPAPLAFDFAFPVASADTDQRQIFSFFMGFTR